MEDPTRRTSTRPDPGSFRDWDGRVFASDGRILRALSAQGLANWEALAATDLYRCLLADGDLVDTRVADEPELAALREADPDSSWSGALSHERVPFVSYPYEWSFSMLQDAALLQLRLIASALDEGLMLKDASPYNIQWRGARPVFIDVGSFERARGGEPWSGYRQFCMLFLFPLMLGAYRRVAFQPWLRGSLDGISPSEFRALFTRRDALRRGMLRHVFLHSRLEQSGANRSDDIREELSAAGFNDGLIKANVDQLSKLVRGLRARPSTSAWEDYRSTCGYDDRDAAQKDDFVRRAVAGRPRRLTWDLGCNDGRFSLIAAGGSEVTIAVDSDPSVVDALYRSLRDDENKAILPLVVDLSNPSPGLGWRNAERATLAERVTPDLTLCLALVHHLSISANVPLREVVSWLRSLESEVVIEFPHRDDPMVTWLLRHKRDEAHPDYHRHTFESLLGASFELVESLELASGSRTLYLARPA